MLVLCCLVVDFFRFRVRHNHCYLDWLRVKSHRVLTKFLTSLGRPHGRSTAQTAGVSTLVAYGFLLLALDSKFPTSVVRQAPSEQRPSSRSNNRSLIIAKAIVGIRRQQVQLGLAIAQTNTGTGDAEFVVLFKI